MLTTLSQSRPQSRPQSMYGHTAQKARQLKYYKEQGIQLMNQIEDKTGVIMCDSEHSHLETSYWNYADSQDIHGLRCVYNKLTKIVDSL